METGIIRMIQPTEQGGYQSQRGWIYTFMMTIDVPGKGQTTGEIGSRSEIYPLNVGDEINFTRTNTQYGVRFKKVNPQYPQQGQSTGQPNAPRKDDKAKNDSICRQTAGKVAGQIVSAMITAGQEFNVNAGLMEISELMTDYFINGIKAGKPMQTQQVQATPTVGGYPVVEDDSIPF